MTKNVLIGVAWPYVNGELHIGHLAGYLIPADIYARYNKLVGNNVLMVSGSDCFGTPITVEADKRGKHPQDIVDEYHAKNLELLLNTLHLSYDLYTKTQTEQHIKITQDIFVALLENGYIDIQETEQYYSPTENKFLPDRYVIGECPFCGYKDSRSDQCDNCTKLIPAGELKNAISNLSKSPVELRSTQHYFVLWDKLQPNLQKYVDQHSEAWKPWVKTETYGWLNNGLKPRAITRDLDWGVPIPLDRIPEEKRIKHAENKRIYVWFDAVIGYYSASLSWAEQQNTPDAWRQFWFDNESTIAGHELKHVYFMGKDNLVFHTLFWPGQIMVFNRELHLPDVVSVNMFLDLDGQKFSKSRGVTVDSGLFAKKFGNDTMRFYLTQIMPETSDASFTWQDFKDRVNGDLVGNLGNFIHRVLSIVYSQAPEIKAISEDSPTALIIKAHFSKVRSSLDMCNFREYLSEVLLLAAYGNKLVNTEEVWNLKAKDEAKFNQVMTDLVAIVLALGYLIGPLMFDASNKVLSSLSIENHPKWPEVGTEVSFVNDILKSVALKEKPTPLFKKLEDTDLNLD